MKNIAIPLLAASSASAQRKDMEADKAVPAPILIADVYNPGTCDDVANSVSTVTTALKALESALAALVTERGPLDTAVTTARTAKQTAIDAVLAKDTEIKTALAADDTAQQSLLNLKGILDQATYDAAAAATALTAATAAKGVADAAKTASETLQGQLGTAATAAGTHYTFEQGQTATALLLKNSTATTHTTVSNELSGLETLYTAAKVTSDATTLTYNNAVADLTAKTATHTKLSAQLVLATNDLVDSTAGTTAKAKADADGVLATKSTSLDTAGQTWRDLARTTVKTFKAYLDDANGDSDYTSITADISCVNTSVLTGTIAAGHAASTGCAAQCKAVAAWGVDGNAVPNVAEGSVSGGSAGITSGMTVCTGYQWKTGAMCKLVLNAIPTIGNSAGGTGETCMSRNKSTKAKAFYVASLLSTTAVSSYTSALTTALGVWETQQALVLAAVEALDVASQYKTKVQTADTAAASYKSTADSAKTTATGPKDANETATAGKLTTVNNKKTEIATALTAMNNASAAWTLQVTEEASQLAAKTLADTLKTAQDGVVTAKTAAVTAAGTAETGATTAKTTADTAKTTAQTNYDAQVTTAGTARTAVTAPLASLTTLRATAATKTTELGTALSNLDDQVTLINTKKGEIKTKETEQLAAIVKCQGVKYDAYARTLATADADRATKLKAISKLIDDKLAPGRGKAGARCEKALSNGTFRDKRNPETICDTGLCCGAARIKVGEAIMTIETCGTAGSKYSYTPPRGPLATAWPTATTHTFTCIEGAKNLAAAASALAAAVYMLA